MLTRRHAAQPHEDFGDVVEQAAQRFLPVCTRGVGQGVDVHVTIAGMSEDHDGDVPPRRGLAQTSDVAAERGERHAAIFDDLE